jgi:SAM-dependent methyltransferase
MAERAATTSAPPRHGHADQVRALFDGKAAGWPGKYAAGGRLAGRLAKLTATVLSLAPAGAELLDLGCGSGDLARRLAAEGYRMTGCDISPRMLEQAAAADPGRTVRWVALEPDWRSLPFAPASVDAVVATSVFEYLADPARVLAECARVLRPGGVLLCTVPRLAHPVRWLEWPCCLAARTPLAHVAAAAGPRCAQYLAYLRTSRQRHRAVWWSATARRAGLLPGTDGQAARGPLSPLAFARPLDGRGRVTGSLWERASTAGKQASPAGTQASPAGTQASPAGTQAGPAGTQADNGRARHDRVSDR